MTEILAPAGGKEQLIAAVRCGADAVYLGARGFNARQNAENFDENSLPEAVAYCHARGVGVHVALNTLVGDAELPALLCELEHIAKSGADAIIVQDLAVASLVRERCPGLAMHASTQMTVHNAAGAKALEELGFSRVVLARELTLDEIRKIAAETSLEIEVFVHGALCMCVSGGCYLSAMLGERSGNRGLCAQPCRLDFHSGNRSFALSLKDMSFVENIARLREAGVCSLKIEGRMKRPEYVAAAVTACRSAESGNPPDMETLRAIFSRGGFTDGYLTGKRNLDMFGHREHDDVTAAAKVIGPLSALYRSERRSVPVDMALTLCVGKPSVLEISDGQNSIEVDGPAPEEALHSPTGRELALRSLSKTGGSPFLLRNFNFISSGSPAIPASALNGLRRQALELLLEERSKPLPFPFLDAPPPTFEKHGFCMNPSIRIRAEKYSQLEFFEDADTVILPLSEITAHPEAIPRFGERLFAELPALIWPFDEAPLLRELLRLKALGLTAVSAENIGALTLAREAGLKLHGGHGLNILNSSALSEYERRGLLDATISFELSLAKILRLGGTLPRGILAYGFLPLMRMRACPIQSEKGCAGCPGNGSLTDRRGTDFRVICSGRRYVTLLNSLPLWLSDKNIQGVDFITLYFTDETPEACSKVYADYIGHSPAPSSRTNGLYFRELK